MIERNMRKRVLITGGAGYVGRVMARDLYRQHELCVVDVLNFGIDRFSPAELREFRLEQADICDPVSMKTIMDDFRPDVIVHLAAMHFIPKCEQEPGAALLINVVGTANLLAACPVDCRFVFASSGAVYAPSEQLHDEHRSETGPRDVYGYSKLHREDYVRYFAANRQFEAVIVRLFNVVGPGETNPHLLPEIVAQMKAGYDRIKLGNLWPKRDYIHVRDAAAGFAAAGFAGSINRGETVTVNLATSCQYSVDDIISRLRAVSGLPLIVEQDAGRVRAVDRPFLGAEINEIRKRFDWRPKYDIDDAVADLWHEPDLSVALTEKYPSRPNGGGTPS